MLICPGLTLRNISEMIFDIEPHLNIQLFSEYQADSIALTFASHLYECYYKKEGFIIVNYWRQLEGHKGGHICVIGGFDPKSNSILILDTNAKRFPLHWISLENFLPLLCKVDRNVNLPRGYLVVKKSV